VVIDVEVKKLDEDKESGEAIVDKPKREIRRVRIVMIDGDVVGGRRESCEMQDWRMKTPM
jgi:hypothetical protein